MFHNVELRNISEADLRPENVVEENVPAIGNTFATEFRLRQAKRKRDSGRHTSFHGSDSSDSEFDRTLADLSAIQDHEENVDSQQQQLEQQEISTPPRPITPTNVADQQPMRSTTPTNGADQQPMRPTTPTKGGDEEHIRPKTIDISYTLG